MVERISREHDRKGPVIRPAPHKIPTSYSLVPPPKVTSPNSSTIWLLCFYTWAPEGISYLNWKHKETNEKWCPVQEVLLLWIQVSLLSLSLQNSDMISVCFLTRQDSAASWLASSLMWTRDPVFLWIWHSPHSYWIIRKTAITYSTLFHF